MAGAAFPYVIAANVREALAPVIADDIVPMTDENSAYLRCARSRHERLDLPAGKRGEGLHRRRLIRRRVWPSPSRAGRRESDGALVPGSGRGS